MTIQDVLARIPNLRAFAEKHDIPYRTLQHQAARGANPGADTLRKILSGLESEREGLAEAIGAVRAMLARKEK